MQHHRPSRMLGLEPIWILSVGAITILIAAVAFSVWRVVVLEKEVRSLATELNAARESLAARSSTLESDLLALRSETVGISETLSVTKADIAAAHTTLSDVQSKVGGVEQVVGSISGTVSTLQKLATVDPELLQKYSKVYFLSENYKPAHLTQIPQEFVYSNSKSEQFMAEALPRLQGMLAGARSQGVEMYIKSGYRSFAEQQSLKSEYAVTYGAGTANSFSADQGYSEHQLGTTVDIIAPGMAGVLTETFDRTPAFAWLKDNAHKYGFVLSYPKGNSYYVYEPWHWRFVGVALANELHNRGIHFYDLDQRDLDPYLASLFD